MKTTVEIPGPLLKQLRERAARQGTTMKALIIAALQQFVSPSRGRRAPFELRDESFNGDGLLPGVREGDWRTTIEQIYEGRGGDGGGR